MSTPNLSLFLCSQQLQWLICSQHTQVSLVLDRIFWSTCFECNVRLLRHLGHRSQHHPRVWGFSRSRHLNHCTLRCWLHCCKLNLPTSARSKTSLRPVCKQGPLFWGPLSETFGRRWIFIVAFIPYICFQVGSALAPNIGSQLAFRFLGGCFAACPLTTSGGLIADIWDADRRGIALAVFALCPFAGPGSWSTAGFIVSTAY